MRKECRDQPVRLLAVGREGFQVYSAFSARPQVGLKLERWEMVQELGQVTLAAMWMRDCGGGRKVEARWAVKMLIQIQTFSLALLTLLLMCESDRDREGEKQ